jgi:hypothetical protein
MDIDSPYGIKGTQFTLTVTNATSHTATPATPLTNEPNKSNLNRSDTVLNSGNSTVGHGSHQQSTNTPTSPSIPINDGTFRLTVCWKPANYDDIYANQTLWDECITDTLIEVFGEFTGTVTLIKWDNNTQNHTCSFGKVKESGGYLEIYISTNYPSGKFRTIYLWTKDKHGRQHPSRWINDRRTQLTMQNNSITISISNSKTNSGDIVTACHILLKHPEYTHRTYYLMSLCRSIPATTPFFDIGLVYTTPHGEKIPHLIVKCGSNHVTALTDVLSDHIDGKKTTALFLATSMLKTMTTEEAHGLFATHKQFIATIQRLPLFPQVINIDRIRTEHNSDSLSTERSTREWATGLRSTETGQLLLCDAENGGRDKRAYLLVPTVFLDQAKIEYEKYKHRLKQHGKFRNSHTQYDNSVRANDRPQEIYIPTAAVLRNLQFMQHMSSESIWKAAPPSVRPRPAAVLQPTQREQNSGGIPAVAQHTARPYSGTQHDHSNPSNNPNHNPKRKSLATVSRTSLSDEATTVCTTQSPLTRNIQTQSTISALEETIHRQQQEIQNMLNRFDAMDTKMEHLTTAIKSGELNQNNTIIQIQQQLDKVCTSLTFLVQQSTNKQPIQQTPQSHNDVHSWVEATDIPTDGKEKGAEDFKNNNVAAASSRSRSPEGKSPE